MKLDDARVEGLLALQALDSILSESAQARALLTRLGGKQPTPRQQKLFADHMGSVTTWALVMMELAAIDVGTLDQLRAEARDAVATARQTIRELDV